MVIYYFGADDTWENLLKSGFRRRNTCILKALSENADVEKIFLVRPVLRNKLVVSLLKKNKNKQSKVVDVFSTNFLPHKYFKKPNIWLNRLLIYCQTKRKNLSSDIIWSYWPGGFFTAENAGLIGTKIFDADHNIAEDPNNKYINKELYMKNLLTIGDKSDYILSSARSMIKWYQGKTKSTLYRLRNGVDIMRFLEKKHQQENVIGYVGTLSKWIDYDLFEEIVLLNKNKKFVIIGEPYLSDGYKQLEKYDNVQFVGNKTAKEVAALLPTFTLALNIYRKHHALDVDSMKLYEYIASNIPVICNEYHEYLNEDFQGLLLLGNNLEDLQKHINTVFNNSQFTSRSTVLSFLENVTWDKRVSAFLSILKKNLEY